MATLDGDVLMSFAGLTRHLVPHLSMVDDYSHKASSPQKTYILARDVALELCTWYGSHALHQLQG